MMGTERGCSYRSTARLGVTDTLVPMAVGLADNRGTSRQQSLQLLYAFTRVSREACRRLGMAPHSAEDPTAAVDPDIDLHDPAQRAELSAHPAILPVIGVGAMVGAGARYALELAWPPESGGVPWATVVTNLSGCLLIGVVMVVVVESQPRHPLWRPFLGVGVLGGYTTFSTYTVQVQQAIQRHDAVLALAYLCGTMAAALLAVTVGTIAARAAAATGERRRKSGENR